MPLNQNLGVSDNLEKSCSRGKDKLRAYYGSFEFTPQVYHWDNRSHLLLFAQNNRGMSIIVRLYATGSPGGLP